MVSKLVPGPSDPDATHSGSFLCSLWTVFRQIRRCASRMMSF